MFKSVKRDFSDKPSRTSRHILPHVTFEQVQRTTMTPGSPRRALQCLACLAVGWSLGAVPALTPAQRESLLTAKAGLDHREPAFDALVENARAGDPAVTSSPSPVEEVIEMDTGWAGVANGSVVLDRGGLYRIEGVIQQQSLLDLPHHDVAEWFIRSDDGTPLLVFVVGLDHRQCFHDGQRVRLDARYYKAIDAMARDGTLHRYPALVGRRPVHVMNVRSTMTGQGSLQPLFPIAISTGALVVGFGAVVLVIRMTRGKRNARPQWRSTATPDNHEALVDETAPLPDDPAEALAELKRRASP